MLIILMTAVNETDNATSMIAADDGGAVLLSYDGTTRFETTNTGAVVTGILTATGIGSFASSVNVVGAQFVGGNLTVGGDLDVTGDINLDEIDARNLNVTGIATIHTLGVTSTTTTTDLSVGAAATVGGTLTATDLSVSAGSTFGGLVDINAGGQANTFKVEDLTDNRVIIAGTGGELADDSNFTFDGANLTLGTGMNVVNVNATGIVTATTFKGVGEVLGIGSEGTPIGSGVSFVDFRSTNGTGVSCQPAVNGIATVTFTPGVSLGLAIALGG